MKPDSVEGSDVEISDLNVSYKPQRLTSKNEFTVRIMLEYICHDSYMDPGFVSDVMEPLSIQKLMDKKLVNLSYGELQRVALTLCLGKVMLSLLNILFILVLVYTCFVLVLGATASRYICDR